MGVMDEAWKRKSAEAAARMRQKVEKHENEGELLTEAYSARLELPVTWLACVEGETQVPYYDADSGRHEIRIASHRYHRFQVDDMVVIDVVSQGMIPTQSNVGTRRPYLELDCTRCGGPARSTQPFDVDAFKDRKRLVNAVTKMLSQDTYCWRGCRQW